MAKFKVGQRVIITHPEFRGQVGVIVEARKLKGGTFYTVKRDGPFSRGDIGFLAADLIPEDPPLKHKD